MAYPKRLFLGLGLSIANGWPNSQGGGGVPVFTLQPQSQTVDEYALASFICEVAGGVAPYSYQWKKNGANVGTNSAALSFTAAAADKNASVIVTITDSAGAAITSTAAVLGVTSYVYQLDGLTQYFKVTPLQSVEPSGVVVSFDFLANTNMTGAISGGAETGYFTWYAKLTGGVTDFYRTATVKIDGIVKASGAPYVLDGAWHRMEITLDSGGYRAPLSAIGGKFNSSSNTAEDLCNSQFKNISIKSNNVTSIIKGNNKNAGANQQQTSGQASLQIVNYNSAGWVAI